MLRYKTRTENNCSSSSSSDDDDYKCIIPKCNNKFSVGNKKKVWKKIYTNNMIINGFNLFVRTINNIIIIGFNRPDDTTFFPIGTVAYWSGPYVYEVLTINNTSVSNVTVGIGGYVPFKVVSSYNITMIPTTTVTTSLPGSTFSIKISGYYQLTFDILIGSAVEAYFSIFVNGYATSKYIAPYDYDYHCNYGSTMLSGTAILKLTGNDVIGIINNPGSLNTVTLATIGTNISITYVGPLSGI